MHNIRRAVRIEADQSSCRFSFYDDIDYSPYVVIPVLQSGIVNYVYPDDFPGRYRHEFFRRRLYPVNPQLHAPSVVGRDGLAYHIYPDMGNHHIP